jgi:signal transduction histidine kinase
VTRGSARQVDAFGGGAEGDDLRSLLERATAPASRRWATRYPEIAPAGVVERSLALLVDALSGPPGTAVPAEIREPSALIEVRQILLDLLRGEFAKLAAEADRAGSGSIPLLRGMLRFEEVGEALQVTGEEQVEAGLSGPRARELLAEIGHDLRSPLTSVLFLSEVLSASPGIREDRHQLRQLGLMHSAAVTMLTLVNNFMELARSGDRAEEMKPSPFSLADLLEGSLRTLRPLADEKGLDFVVANRVTGPDRRTGYPVSLSRILLNLGSNAIKFTAEGHVTIRVSEPAPGLVEFVVEDTGPGMDTENQRQLEDVFEPSATGGRVQFSGSGLGLVIVRKLLRRSGSELHLHSEPGRGTRVSFTLPLAEAG